MLWFGGMTGLHSITYGVLKIPSLICASTSVLPPFSILRDRWGSSSEENCVSAAVNHTIYGASTKLLLSVLQT